MACINGFTLCYKLGSDVSWTVTITRNTVAVDITGGSVILYLYNTQSDITPVSTLTLTLTSPLSGIATLTQTPAQIETIGVGDYYATLKYLSSDNSEGKVVPGLFSITR